MTKILFLVVMIFVSSMITKSQNLNTGDLNPVLNWVSDSTVGAIKGFAVHPNGDVYAFGGAYKKDIGKLFVFDGTNGKVKKVDSNITGEGEIIGIDLSPDGKYLALKSSNITIFNLENNWKKEFVINGDYPKFTPDSKTIIYCSYYNFNNTSDSSLVLLNLETNSRRYITNEEWVRGYAVSSDQKYIAVTRSKKNPILPNKRITTIDLWDYNECKFIKEIYRYDGDNLGGDIGTEQIHFSPDNKYLGSRLGYTDLILFNLTDNSIYREYNANNFRDGIGNFYFYTNKYLLVYANEFAVQDLETNTKMFQIDLKAYKAAFEYSPIYNSIMFGGYNIYSINLDKIFNGVGVQEPMNINLIDINYQTGNLTMGNLNFNQIQNIQIYDFQGKLVFNQYDLNVNNSELSLPINLIRGVYIIKYKVRDSSFTQKFIVN